METTEFKKRTFNSEKFNGNNPIKKNNKNDVVNAQVIFKSIQHLNVENIFGAENNNAIQAAEMFRVDLKKFVNSDSLAFKILDGKSFQLTNKQLWVIAFELEKNEEYKENIKNLLNK